MRLSKKLSASIVGASMLLNGLPTFAAAPEIEAFRATEKANSYYYKISVPATMVEADPVLKKTTNYSLNSSVQGVIVKNNANQKNDAAFLFRVDYKGGPIWEGIIDEDNLRFAFEGKLIGQNVYFKINDYSEWIDELAEGMLAPIKNVWMQFSRDQFIGGVAEGISGLSSMDPSAVLADVDTSDKSNSTDQAKKAQDAKDKFYNSGVLSISGTLPDATIDGTKVRRSILKIDKKALRDFIVNFTKEKAGSNGSAEMTQADIDMMDEAFASLEFSGGEIALSEDNKLVDLKLIVRFSDVSDETANAYQLEVKPEWLTKGINDPKYKVEAPKGALNEEQLSQRIDKAMGSTSGSYDKAYAESARTVSDVKQMQTALELYYNDAGKYPIKLDFGKPLVYKNTTYMTKLPTHATYSGKTNVCPAKPSFKYASVNGGKSYNLKYCLESIESYNISSGNWTASPEGMKLKDEDAKNAKYRALSILNKEKTLAEKVKKSQGSSNQKNSKLVGEQLQLISSALSVYNDVNGSYPTSLELGKKLASGKTVFLNSVPHQAKYNKPVNCVANSDFKYTPVYQAGTKKVVDYKLEYCVENSSGWDKFAVGKFTASAKSDQSKEDKDRINKAEEAESAKQAEYDKKRAVLVEERVKAKEDRLIKSGKTAPLNAKIDSETVSYVRQIQTAAELYYNDEQEYPVNIAFGQPLIGKNGKTTYMTKIPSPKNYYGPKNCPNGNLLQYARKSSSTYELKYCIEDKSGNIPDGENIASPSGVTNR